MAGSPPETMVYTGAFTSRARCKLHGSLVSPDSSEEEDGKLLVLAAMMHELTSEILCRSA